MSTAVPPLRARPRILFTTEASARRDAFFPPHVLSALEGLGDVEYHDGDQALTSEQLAARLPDIDACVTHWGCPTFTSEVMSSANRLKLIAHAGGSVGDLVSPAVYDRGVVVTSANSAMSAHVAEGALAYLLLDLHRLLDRDRLMSSGGWMAPEASRCKSLSTITLGLVGLGDIGRRLLELVAPFGTRVLVHDPFVASAEISRLGAESAQLDDLLEQSDAISLHASLTSDSKGMLDDRRLTLIRDGALLMNTARSALVDGDAMMRHLARGRIRAVLDVFDVEPLPADSPLRSMPGVTVMPHSAGSSSGSEVSSLAIEEVARFARGEPPAHPVGLDRYLRMTRETANDDSFQSKLQG